MDDAHREIEDCLSSLSLEDARQQLEAAVAAAETDGRRFKRQGTKLYSDSIAHLKNDFGKKTQAMNVEGIGRISYMANAGCRDIARLISNRAEQSDVAVAMRTCCDWAGYGGLEPVPRDMAERLLRLCVLLLSHAML